MACPRALFRMPFDIQVTSTADILRLLGREITIVGADAFDFALTVSRQTGLARAVPVAATMVYGLHQLHVGHCPAFPGSSE